MGPNPQITQITQITQRDALNLQNENTFRQRGFALSLKARSRHILDLLQQLEGELQTKKQLSRRKCRGKAQWLALSEVPITTSVEPHRV